MDEIELRIAAYETALIEVLGWVGLDDPEALADAERCLRERARGDVCQDERTIRLAAADLVRDGALRLAAPWVMPSRRP